MANASGQHFVIDDLFVTGDKLDLRYRAIGVAAMKFGQPPPPQCRTQPRTIINVASNGNLYVPYDGSEGGQEGMLIIRVNSWRFTGEPPHHLDISVVQLICDANASWTIPVDN